MQVTSLNKILSSSQYLVENVLAVQKPSEMVEPYYLDCELIFPAQTRFSSEVVKEKIAWGEPNAVWDESEKKWKLKHDEGRSWLKLEEAIPVVKAPFGFISVDGHHDILANFELGGTTVPVREIADLSHCSIEEFWRKAEENGWAYLHAFGGEKTEPIKRFQDLADDSNRRFAGLVGRKYYTNGSSWGADYPIWIKQERDIPFIEFKIADALWSAGLVYTPGEEFSIEFVEKARSVLLEANIEGLKIVPTRLHYSQIIPG